MGATNEPEALCGFALRFEWRLRLLRGAAGGSGQTPAPECLALSWAGGGALGGRDPGSAEHTVCLRELLGCHLSYLHSSRGSRLLGVQKWQLTLGAESAALGSHGGLWSGLGWAGTIPGGPCSRGTELVRGIARSPNGL